MTIDSDPSDFDTEWADAHRDQVGRNAEVKASRRSYWYGRSRLNRWPLWASWLLAPSKENRRIVRELMQLRRAGVDV